MWTKKSAKAIRKEVRGCLQNLSQSVAIHLKYVLLALITSTKVFSLIIVCKVFDKTILYLDILDHVPRDLTILYLEIVDSIHNTVFARSVAMATNVFNLLRREATIQERLLFESGVYLFNSALPQELNDYVMVFVNV